jgi:hypothetical protein
VADEAGGDQRRPSRNRASRSAAGRRRLGERLVDRGVGAADDHAPRPIAAAWRVTKPSLQDRQRVVEQVLEALIDQGVERGAQLAVGAPAPAGVGGGQRRATRRRRNSSVDHEGDQRPRHDGRRPRGGIAGTS